MRSCYRIRYSESLFGFQELRKPLENLEARVGIEPTHKGFADLSLTTWVPRHHWVVSMSPVCYSVHANLYTGVHKCSYGRESKQGSS